MSSQLLYQFFGVLFLTYYTIAGYSGDKTITLQNGLENYQGCTTADISPDAPMVSTINDIILLHFAECKV